MNLFTLSLVAGSIVVASAVPAATIMQSFSVNEVVPDGDPSGTVDVQNITGSQITEIESVTVTVDISGSFNGDLYAYVSNSSGLAVLLNRPGRTSTTTFGYADSGLVFTFSDTATTNAHNYRNQVMPVSGAQVIGTFQPDGRITDPGVVLDTDTPSPTASLSALNGGPADGEWRLFVADLSGGSTHTVNSWSVEVVGVPEPSSALLSLAAIGVLAFRRRR